MTKSEIYNALIAEGLHLAPINKLSKADLEAKWMELHPEEKAQEQPADEQFGNSEQLPEPDAIEKHDADSAVTEASEAPEAPETKEQPVPALFFSSGGWCDALQRSYFCGWYHPSTWYEYEALAPYADKEPPK